MLDLIERINVRVAGLALAAGYTILIISIYVSQPQRPSDVIGCLGFDRSAFESGRESFRRASQLTRQARADEFANARNEFDVADPRRCNAETQFYLAYSHYRAGCRRLLPVNREQYEMGLEAINSAIELASGEEVIDDPGLNLRTPEELREALEESPAIRAIRGCR